ncbi:hypothetical protein [Sphingobium sp. Cam5-1]|uniref:hypothetical protein n=1 Tax=Sphingobium sp. Cam5-1 TaxID=2789327 RepID=UPI0018AD153C|nr:hypothetical protein [Sphingobium sp. Cam5-1]QPI74464.1 hypothetical protein IZV00_10135 [Sphingobium sp. Cam5-1]
MTNAAGSRRVEMPDDLVSPPPTPFPVAELIRTAMDRWHTSGFDIPPYARLFGEMKARIEGREPTLPERAATFDDAVRGQAVPDAIRLSSRRSQWQAIST